jgi:hypothetical protein
MNWRHTVRIKDLLSRDDSDENAQRIATVVVERLRNTRFMQGFRLRFFERVETVDDFNDAMNHLYDFCDANAIWVE